MSNVATKHSGAYLRARCPNCKRARRMGHHLHDFEFVTSSEQRSGWGLICRSCGCEAQLSRVAQERPF